MLIFSRFIPYQLLQNQGALDLRLKEVKKKGGPAKEWVLVGLRAEGECVGGILWFLCHKSPPLQLHQLHNVTVTNGDGSN